MISRRSIAGLALLASLAGAPLAFAQDAASRIGVCNPARVFNDMDERKAVEDRIRRERENTKIEVDRRQLELRDLETQRNQLKPDSAQYQDKNSQLMQKAVEFEVWARLKEAELGRLEKEQVKLLYDKITEASKAVAEARKLDLVLTERRPEIPGDMRNVTPDQLRALLTQRDVLYMSDRADVTPAVVLEVNRRYAAGGTGAGTGTAAPAGGTTPPPAR